MNRDAVLHEMVKLVQVVAADWDLDDDVSESTGLFGNLNWRSVDLVVLANDIQDHFGQTFPFVDMLAERELAGQHDLTVGELTDFVHRHLSANGAG